MPFHVNLNTVLKTYCCVYLFSGGVHNGEYVSWLYCYDPVMDVWARKQDMNTKRAIHVLAGMNDRLYAIGGNHLKGEYFRFLENCSILCERDAAGVANLHYTSRVSFTRHHSGGNRKEKTEQRVELWLLVVLFLFIQQT